MDLRIFQLLALGSLVTWGVLGLDLEIVPLHGLAIVTSAVATEALGRRWRGEPFDASSPIVTALSLTMLLRVAHPGLAAGAAVLAIGSKFLLRAGGGHFFNPANFGIVVLLLASEGAWVSAGQWGHAVLLGLAMAGAGQFVIHRAARSDVTWAFLLTWAGLLFGRALWLGDPWAIPWHQLQNGALLIFAFFMISDPRTTPRARPARVAFALVVAGLGFALVYGAYLPNGMLYALFAAAPLVPLLDRWLPGPVFHWAPTKEVADHAPHPGPLAAHSVGLAAPR
ncbi:MAG: hypothetical protein CL910_21260 [Deltaproteobacteria bacterium]|jgi:Na+-transporting NADH:ubiquinone oxidoreductase subunit NqrB|nr:hypothetical protein [Deltaproteobacteria bacterium]